MWRSVPRDQESCRGWTLPSSLPSSKYCEETFTTSLSLSAFPCKKSFHWDTRLDPKRCSADLASLPLALNAPVVKRRHVISGHNEDKSDLTNQCDRQRPCDNCLARNVPGRCAYQDLSYVWRPTLQTRKLGSNGHRLFICLECIRRFRETSARKIGGLQSEGVPSWRNF